jgi:RNA polymerase sigma-70 factor (ECF subfamily)
MTELEKTLVESIKEGDIKSFRTVFQSYYSKLCKYSKSRVHDYDAASDIVKDVFVKWWEHHSEITITTSVSSYLFRSVHNGCINYIQRVLNNKLMVNESDLPGSLNELSNHISPDYAFADISIQELRTALEKAISSLPDHCREIFILSRLKQKSHHQIASHLGISPNTVKVQIYRALLKLKEDLREYLVVLLVFLIGSL